MIITKTKFLNYTRCPRYCALDGIKDLDEVTYADYKAEERKEELRELSNEIMEIDETVDEQLEVMLPYYKSVELEAGRIFAMMMGGVTICAENTKEQVSFKRNINGTTYLCYVDIYNENDKEINIVEVKATTSKKYTDLKGLFTKKGNIYYVNNIPEKQKLFNRYGVGEYIHDLAVQRYFIESDKPVHYYLGVLNANYVFDGTYENNEPVYKKINNQELITFFAMDEITKEYLPFIDEERKQLEGYLANLSMDEVPLSNSCGYKKPNACKYFPVCGKRIPKENSSLCYVNNGFGFLKEDQKRIKGLDLINAGYLHMLDVPLNWLKNANHLIQRNCVQSHVQYINKEKIKKALNSLEYPIYHLDFETFPCPLPRFKGEFPYIQSPFEFSLHIETSPGVCKKDNNIVFLASSTNDEREELIKTLLDNVNVNIGTLFAQNVSFEKGRIKELASIFPEYHDKLMKLYNRGFDLLWIVNNNKELYKALGFSGNDINTFNFYDERLNGSFSIKKTLPVFSNLSYKDLEIKNGTSALVTYAKYNTFTKEELTEKMNALKIYCSQDTWAMVEILNSLRKIVK